MDEMTLINYVLSSGGGAGAGVYVTYLLMSSRMKRLEDDQRQCKEVCMTRMNKVESVQHDMEIKILTGITDLKMNLTEMKADIAVVKNSTNIGERLEKALDRAAQRLTETQELHRHRSEE